MPVLFSSKVIVKRDDITHQIKLKFLHIQSCALASQKFPPRIEKILDGNDILVGMNKLNFTHNSDITPPQDFYQYFKN